MFGFDDRTRALLHAVWKHGNVSEAAQSVGLDGANARRHLTTAARRQGVALVESRVGGKGGRNTRLTDAGRRFLQMSALVGVAGAFDEEQGTTPIRVGARTLHAAGRWGPGRVELAILPASVAIEKPTTQRRVTSVRNQFPARVDSVREQPEGTFLVSLAAGALRLESLVTRGAVRGLRLRRGMRVVAVLKAVAIEVADIPTSEQSPA